MLSDVHGHDSLPSRGPTSTPFGERTPKTLPVLPAALCGHALFDKFAQHACIAATVSAGFSATRTMPQRPK
jgi:hypothetical protein